MSLADYISQRSINQIIVEIIISSVTFKLEILEINLSLFCGKVKKIKFFFSLNHQEIKYKTAPVHDR